MAFVIWRGTSVWGLACPPPTEVESRFSLSPCWPRLSSSFCRIRGSGDENADAARAGGGPWCRAFRHRPFLAATRQRGRSHSAFHLVCLCRAFVGRRRPRGGGRVPTPTDQRDR